MSYGCVVQELRIGFFCLTLPIISKCALHVHVLARVRFGEQRRDIAFFYSTLKSGRFSARKRVREPGPDRRHSGWVRAPSRAFLTPSRPVLGAVSRSLCGPGLRLGPSYGCLRSSPLWVVSLRPNGPSGSASPPFGPVRLLASPPIPAEWAPPFQPSDTHHAPKVVLLLRACNPGTS